MARQGSLLLLGRKRPRPAVDAPRVVAFVHGYGAGGAVFDPLRREVEARLELPTLDFTYRSTWSFAKVMDALEEELDRARGAEIDLVGHSLGGLVARWWVQERGGAERTRRLVTLATPHAGTRSARLAPGPLRGALMPDGAIVRRLAVGRHRAAQVRHTALVASADAMVKPVSSAAALEDADVHWFDGLGHNAMLFDRRVHDRVLKALEEAHAADEASLDQAL